MGRQERSDGVDPPLRGSVTTWLDGLKDLRHDAAQNLWNRYFAQLVAIARRHLQGGRDADEEDVALSALKSAFLGVQNNRFPDLYDRTGLWPLLVTLTSRKAITEHHRQRAQKRTATAESRLPDMGTVASDEPTPELALSLAETIETLVRELGDDALRTIALRKLEGFTNGEIAKELGIATRTVVRKLARIRQEWEVVAE
jgi:RNA polymerase sigma factor (sigma-70 family)